MKKIISSVLALTLLLATLPAAGCKDEKKQTNTGGTETTAPVAPVEKKDYLVLGAYSITMFVGESYDLTVKKYDANGTEQTIESTSYNADYEAVASVENGKITAKQVGSTYVTVTADGVSAACYVNVQSGARGENLEIRFAEDVLYEGVPAQAYVYVIKDGVMHTTVTDVTWESSDETLFTVGADGKITASQPFETATVTAKFTYNGQEQTLTKTLSAGIPYHYQTTASTVRLALGTTYSGAKNTKYTSNSLTVERIHLGTGEKTVMPQSAFTVTADDALVETTVSAEGTVTFTVGEKLGESQAILSITDSNRKIRVKLQVSNAIASIEDMDALSLASQVKTEDLAKDYMLVNDIDYDGKIIYPIADNNKIDNASKPRPIGYQWKYLLDYDETNGYTYVPRADVGKAGIGLTDEEMLTFAMGNGINPTATKFSGTFDGNGYSVKNAALMFAPQYVESDHRSVRTSVFGETVGATIRNVAFTNLTLQTPDDTLAYGQPYDISYFRGDEGFTAGKYHHNGTQYLYYGAALVQRTKNTSFENVYLEMDYTRAKRYALIDGAMVNWTQTGTSFENCAVFVESGTSDCYALSGNQGANGSYKNNIAIGNISGVTQGTLTLNDGTNGQDGNWCYKVAKPTDWKDFFKAVKGTEAQDVRSIEDTLKTYDADVWNLANFNATVGGAPTLINGCSANGK